MRDSMGGSVVLVIIVVFIVIALGYMAFNVNYTKAFRMKNKIISVYEDYDGECLSECQKRINEYAKTIGYSVGKKINCPNGFDGQNGIYCYKKFTYVNREYGENVVNDLKEKHYYRIITKINVEIPIINNILDLKIFYITGDTKTFEE